MPGFTTSNTKSVPPRNIKNTIVTLIVFFRLSLICKEKIVIRRNKSSDIGKLTNSTVEFIFSKETASLYK
jgi:hypothetical protein